MKKIEILRILDTYSNEDEATKMRIANALLDLSNVVGRSEQLRAFKQFLQSEYHLPVSNRMVDEFEQKQSS